VLKYRPPAWTGGRPGRQPSRENGDVSQKINHIMTPSSTQHLFDVFWSICMDPTQEGHELPSVQTYVYACDPEIRWFPILDPQRPLDKWPRADPFAVCRKESERSDKEHTKYIERGPQHVTVLSIPRPQRTTAPKVRVFVLKHPQMIQARDRRLGHVLPQICAPRRTNTTSKMVLNLIRLRPTSILHLLGRPGVTFTRFLSSGMKGNNLHG